MVSPPTLAWRSSTTATQALAFPTPDLGAGNALSTPASKHGGVRDPFEPQQYSGMPHRLFERPSLAPNYGGTYARAPGWADPLAPSLLALRPARQECRTKRNAGQRGRLSDDVARTTNSQESPANQRMPICKAAMSGDVDRGRGTHAGMPRCSRLTDRPAPTSQVIWRSLPP